MKKLLLFLLLFIPIIVNASTADMYKEVHIKPNGDVLIKEHVNLKGTYNGLELFYTFKYFDEFEMFSADEFELIRVCEATMKQEPETCFEKVDSARVGDSKVFEYEQRNISNKLKIYNPSNISSKPFYIEYILKNLVVKHNDIAELRLNLLDENFNENLDNFEMYIYLPESDSDFRIWGHGPLYGETKRIDDKTAYLSVKQLPSNTMVDVRMTFSNDLVFESVKNTNEDKFDLILEEEMLLAEQANSKRTRARFITYYLPLIWLIGLIIMWIYIYVKFDKEHKNNFDEKYYRDFPAEFPMETVQFLMEHKIDTNSLSASLLDIIRKKGLLVEELEIKAKLFSKNTKDYKLIFSDELKEDLTENEVFIREWFLNSFGDSKSFELSNIKKTIKNETSAKKFMDKYKEWEKNAKILAKKENFYEDNSSKKILPCVYAFLPIIGIAFGFPTYFVFLIIGLIFFGYIINFKRRTKEGNEYYHKYSALKRFLIDFGNFKDRDLPEVHLWEKYLVFATIFKVAEKVMKQMEIKLQQVKEINPNVNMNIFTYLYLNNAISRSVNSSVTSAYTSAAKEMQKAAASRSSSGGGFGGGFSGGGGFGGGGGMGGGRF